MGKSSTIASIVEHRAKLVGGKFITLEAPIEYLYAPLPDALFSQREIGAHVGSYAEGLVEAMHQSPDVIVVQEIRDCASAEAALSAALTGHLVVASIHASDACSVPQRLGALLEGEGDESAAWREALAAALQGILVQQLYRSEQGLVPVFEFLACQWDGRRIVAVERAIRANDWIGLRQCLVLGARQGSFPFATSFEQRRMEGLLS
jgi:Tfp pilus assembly pilus retraction ATPase PilT